MATIKVPKYVKTIVTGFKYDFDVKNCNPGYTIRVYKPRDRMLIPTFEALVERMVKWAEGYYAEAHIDYVPKETHYTRQYIVVTITDPVMQVLEKYR